jgi:diguanylate cyclase (GGDEF)-like protein
MSGMLDRFPSIQGLRQQLFLGVLTLCLPCLGWWAGESRARDVDAEMRELLLRQAVEIARNINPALVRNLTFSAADKGAPAFEHLREQMIASGQNIMGSWAPEMTYLGIYSIAMRGGTIVFGPENIDESDPRASKPGAVYRRPPAGILDLVKSDRGFTKGPYTDEYGTYVSAFAPVLDPHSGEMLMVVGMDIEALDWQTRVAAAHLKPILTALFMMGMLWVGALLLRRYNRREISVNMNLKAWIIAPVTVAMLAGLAFWVSYQQQKYHEKTRKDVRRLLDLSSSEWNRHIGSQVQMLRAQMDHIARDPGLLEAWHARNLEALAARARPVFAELKRACKITHVYFHSPDRTCFLRAHQPERRGDLIDRRTMLIAADTGEEAWGSEIGPLGAFTLRLVRPWTQDGKLLGYLELGMEIEHLVDELAEDLNIELVSVIRKEQITREKFEAGRQAFGFAGHWDDYPDLVVAHQMVQTLPEELDRRLRQGRCALDAEQPFYIQQAGRTLACGLVSLPDVTGRLVADLIVLHDVTAEAGFSGRELALNVGVAIVSLAGILALLWSITGKAERHLAGAFGALRESETRFRGLFENAINGVAVHEIVLDDNGHPVDYVLLEANAAFEKQTGLRVADVLGKRVTQVLPGIEKGPLIKAYGSVAIGGEPILLEEFVEPLLRYYSISAYQVGRGRFATVFQDITARKAIEEELRTAARTDKLTGLPNRALFCDRLQQAILRARRLRDYRFAVLFLDFDRFKLINDSLGHDMGDLLLQEIADRLRSAVRSGDSLSREAREHTSARLGGDEFVVLLDGIEGPGGAQDVADRLLDVFSKPYRIGEHTVYSTASIGIVTSDIAAGSADGVLRDADTAMYEAKLAGKGRYVVFTESMRQRVQNRMNLENDLRKALEDGQLFLVYQPIVSLESGQIHSFESLIRWRHPQRGLISPAEFVPIAEETGLIPPIGEWVLRESCRQLGRWRTQNPAAANWSISVNLSRVQLLLPGLPETVARILRETGISPESLHLEITESAVMQNVEQATQILRTIKDIGVKLDLDDFGTGYSSLSCLHQFPLDVLKIDRSFVANIERGRDFAALIHAVASLARNLGISVIAEGIETAEQLAVLQTLECEFGQGYLFAKPMAAEEAAGFQLKPGVLPGALLAEAACPGDAGL